MDSTRASEIASTEKMVHVTYNGDPVYIEFVNETKDTASVHRLSDPQKSQEVAVTQLVEAK